MTPTSSPSPNTYTRVRQRLRELTRDVETAPRVFLSARQGFPSLDRRGSLRLFAAGFAAMALLSVPMHVLYARFQAPLLPMAVVAVLLVPICIAWLRAHERALLRREAVMARQDASLPGWWLDLEARRLEPQQLPGQVDIDLGREDFMLVVGVFRRRPYASWATLTLQHARLGTAVELGRWRLNSASMRSAEYTVDLANGGGHQEAMDGLVRAVHALADALARRLSLRRQHWP